MAKEYSKKSCYPSRYGGGNVTIAQYITEYLCENAASLKKKDLPQNFWELEDWEKFFKAQIILLNKMFLNKGVHPRALVKALKDKRCYGVNSFGGFLKVPKWKQVLLEKVKECEAEDKKTAELKETVVVDATMKTPSKIEGKKALLNKLSELDNGEERERGS